MFTQAIAGKVGGKFLSFGDTSSGKSYFQLTFPKVACIDSEASISHYIDTNIVLNNGKSYNNLVFIDTTSDLDELEDDIESLIDGEYDGQIETLSIDSETKFYNTMQVGALEVEERRARKKGGDIDDAGISQKQWGRIKLINMKLQRAKLDLSSKGVHIVSVAQEAEIKDEEGKVLGHKPDMHKTVKFDYDTILRHFTKKDKQGNISYYAEVIKDRTNVTKVGQIIENPSFDIWKSYYDSKNGLSTNVTSYKKDIKTSTDSMISESDQVDALINEWKQNMQGLQDRTKITDINNKMKELKITVKNMHLCDLSDIQELVDFTKSICDNPNAKNE